MLQLGILNCMETLAKILSSVQKWRYFRQIIWGVWIFTILKAKNFSTSIGILCIHYRSLIVILIIFKTALGFAILISFSLLVNLNLMFNWGNLNQTKIWNKIRTKILNKIRIALIWRNMTLITFCIQLLTS